MRDLVDCGRSLKAHQIALEMGFLSSSVFMIVHVRFALSELLAESLSHTLMEEFQTTRVEYSRRVLAPGNADPDNFHHCPQSLRPLRVHHHDP